jgi:hypothetical protein
LILFTFSGELLKSVREKLATGKTLRPVLMEPGMAERVTMLRWAERHPEFGARGSSPTDGRVSVAHLSI